MQYPHEYTAICEQEQVTVSGGTPMDAFNYLLGDWLRNKVLGDFRNATWDTLDKKSTQPVKDWGKKFWGFSIFAKGAYLYGVFHLFETLQSYWDKK